MNKDNKLKKIFILPAIVVAGLMLLYFLPEFHILDDETLKKVDILSDVRKLTYSDSEADKLIAEAEAERKKMLDKDSVPEGITPIEDFSAGDSVRIMDAFYKALTESKKLDRPIRIAYYGDSFIGGDIITSDLRDFLQTKYGGEGAGAVDLVKSYSRANIIQESVALTQHVPTKRMSFNTDLQSMNNFYATSDVETSSAKQTGRKSEHGAFTNKWSNSFLFFRPINGTTVQCKIDGSEAKEVYSGKSDQLQMVKVEGDTHSVEWNFTGKGNVFYFAANEGKNGVVLDNFGIVSVQGTHLKTIPQSTLEEFAAVRPYDLIIMQYGLNVASPEVQDNYRQYAKGMGEVIEKFRSAWPKAAILLVSVSDRCKGQQNGKPTTMKGIEELVLVQRELAKQKKIAFWSMFSAMGGNGSMGRLAAEGNAEKDYTHMNHKGGKIIAKYFYDAIDNAIFNYKRRMVTMDEYDKKVNGIKDITRD